MDEKLKEKDLLIEQLEAEIAQLKGASNEFAPSSPTARSIKSPDRIQRPKAVTAAQNINTQNRYKMLATLGQHVRPTETGEPNLTVNEIKWLIRTANEKNEENQKLRRAIEDMKQNHDQYVRKSHKEIDLLQHQIQAITERYFQEQILAERWRNRAESYKERLEKTENDFKHPNSKKIQKSHLINGINALVSPKNQHVDHQSLESAKKQLERLKIL